MRKILRGRILMCQKELDPSIAIGFGPFKVLIRRVREQTSALECVYSKETEIKVAETVHSYLQWLLIAAATRKIRARTKKNESFTPEARKLQSRNF